MAEHLLEILRAVAIRNQRRRPRSFFPIRQVARHFRSPISTVWKAYRQLEREGLVTRVRGSKTVLQGLRYNRGLRVRAVVGLPALESIFITIPEYRMFFTRIRRELRLRGFVSAITFFDPVEARTDALANRLRDYEVDTVLWFVPPAVAEQTALRLSDLGIRLLGICEGMLSPIPCRYQLRREIAIRQLLVDWRSGHGINEVVIVESSKYRSPATEQALHAALDDLAFRSATAVFQNQSKEAFLRGLKSTKPAGIIFASGALASMFGFRRPTALASLLETKHVAFVDGPITTPFAKPPDIRVDVITFHWEHVIKRIVDDLVSREAFEDRGPTIFEAEACLRVPLSRFA